MFARLISMNVKPDRIDKGIQEYNQVIEKIRGMRGMHGAYLLVDRETGDAASVAFWETLEDMEAATEIVRTTLARDADDYTSPPKIRTWEVATHTAGVPA